MTAAERREKAFMTDIVDQIQAIMAPDPFEVCADLDFSFIKAMVPKGRSRSFSQRDVMRAIRAAKAAGLEVREIAPDGRVILGPVSVATETDDAILAKLQ
jgi:hypothetical protein